MIHLNGKPYEGAPERLMDLLALEGIAPEVRGVAVALNDAVVPRSSWAETKLSDGDRIEIVKIMQGG